MNHHLAALAWALVVAVATLAAFAIIKHAI